MRTIIVFAFILFFSQFAMTAENKYLETFPDGTYINWTAGEVGATGSSILKGKEWNARNKIDAYRAAQLDAMRKLVEVMGKIRIDSENTIAQYQEGSGLIRKKVEGVARNFTEKDVRFSTDGICNVDVVVPINGDGRIADIFLSGTDTPRVKDFTENKAAASQPLDSASEETQKPSQEKAEVKDTPSAEVAKTTSEETTSSSSEASDQAVSQTTVTGLVVNASGINVKPALNPQIVSESGEEIYGFKKANRDFRRLNGLASYAPDMKDACLDKRVTEKPFVMNAKSLSKDKPCIIIVSNEEALKFNEYKNSNRVLEHCRVIIVTQPASEKSAQS